MNVGTEIEYKLNTFCLPAKMFTNKLLFADTIIFFGTIMQINKYSLKRNCKEKEFLCI